ncbi:GNAT family N-acetyltransferase [Candidatus Hodarchaeum mangrovi]
MVVLENYSEKREFKGITVLVRSARMQDKKLVWEGYKNAPEEFYQYIPPVTEALVDQWYPKDKGLDFTSVLPLNALKVNVFGSVSAFIGNVSLVFEQMVRMAHVAMMGLAVLPPYQNIGIGTFLIQQAVKIASSIPNLKKLELQVCAKNIVARHVYSKCGFNDEGVHKKRWLYPNGEFDDLISMGLILPNDK